MACDSSASWPPAEPPVTATKQPSGNATSTDWRLFSRAPRTVPSSGKRFDGLPDAVMRGNDYRPANGAAIGDLMTLFDF